MPIMNHFQRHFEVPCLVWRDHQMNNKPVMQRSLRSLHNYVQRGKHERRDLPQANEEDVQAPAESFSEHEVNCVDLMPASTKRHQGA